jgi:hypothetical protein
MEPIKAFEVTWNPRLSLGITEGEAFRLKERESKWISHLDSKDKPHSQEVLKFVVEAFDCRFNSLFAQDKKAGLMNFDPRDVAGNYRDFKCIFSRVNRRTIMSSLLGRPNSFSNLAGRDLTCIDVLTSLSAPMVTNLE